MNEFATLANHFLIAMPALEDPNFSRTVTLICQHTPEGALGIVVNRLTNLSLGDVLEQLQLPSNGVHRRDMPILFGGPVQIERGFILHEPLGAWDSTMAVDDALSLTTSRDILQALARNEGPARCLMALGYAGWAAGQLEREMVENAWLSVPASHELLFDVPIEDRWQRAVEMLGIDHNALSHEAGHA
jgi:putative transcriptional regulator